MTKEVFETGYIKPNGDDWYNMIMGTFFGMSIYGSAGAVFLMILRLPKFFTPLYLFSIFCTIIYRYWQDTQVTFVKTGLTEKENLNILTKTFNQLEWNIYKSPNKIVIGDKKYILKFVQVRIFYTDNLIGYNFRYTSNTKGGRPAFFLGIRSYLKKRFENHLDKRLN